MTQFFTNCKWKNFFGALPVDSEPGILISGSGEAWDQANAQGDPDASHSPEKKFHLQLVKNWVIFTKNIFF